MSKHRTVSRLSVVAAALGALALSSGCEVEQTEEGELPDVDVDVSEGNLPEFDVDAPDVDIESREEQVEVPTGVDIETEERTITVPDVDIEPADEDEPDR